MKNKIGCRFFASFECASVSGWETERCSDERESVQFQSRQKQTYRETLHGNSYAFTGLSLKSYVVKSHEKFVKTHEKWCKTYRFTLKSLNFYVFRDAKNDETAHF